MRGIALMTMLARWGLPRMPSWENWYLFGSNGMSLLGQIGQSILGRFRDNDGSNDKSGGSVRVRLNIRSIGGRLYVNC